VTSLRQWAANRENAQRSTGPRTPAGKRRSRQNALRHGLTAQTVIDGLEDGEDYRAFEAAIVADYDAHTALERELVLRLASLLWRIRRASGIETDLLRIQAEIITERVPGSGRSWPTRLPVLSRMFRSAWGPPQHAPLEHDVEKTCPAADGGWAPVFKKTSCSRNKLKRDGDANKSHHALEADAQTGQSRNRENGQPTTVRRDLSQSRRLTHSFLRLANLDNCIFDRLARYEAAMWRQIVQILIVLEPLSRRRSTRAFSAE
jgi:hypothetical protein